MDDYPGALVPAFQSIDAPHPGLPPDDDVNLLVQVAVIETTVEIQEAHDELPAQRAWSAAKYGNWLFIHVLLYPNNVQQVQRGRQKSRTGDLFRNEKISRFAIGKKSCKSSSDNSMNGGRK